MVLSWWIGIECYFGIVVKYSLEGCVVERTEKKRKRERKGKERRKEGKKKESKREGGERKEGLGSILSLHLPPIS